MRDKQQEFTDILTREKNKPNNDIWKYYIDSPDWNLRDDDCEYYGTKRKPGYIYDNGCELEGIDPEPGYIEESLKTFDEYVLNIDNAKKKLTVDLLQKIRDSHNSEILIKLTRHRVGKDHGAPYTSAAITDTNLEKDENFGLSLLNLMELAGIYSRHNNTHDLVLADKNYYTDELCYYSHGLSDPDIATILTDYEKQLQHVNKSNPNDVVMIITRLIKKLELLHIWGDGNGRTLTMTLLYKEFIRNNLFPPIQSNPNNFDLLPTGTLATHLLTQSKHSENYFTQRMRHPEKNLDLVLTQPAQTSTLTESPDTTPNALLDLFNNLSFNDFIWLIKEKVFSSKSRDKYYKTRNAKILDLKDLKVKVKNLIDLVKTINKKTYKEDIFPKSNPRETLTFLATVNLWCEKVGIENPSITPETLDMWTSISKINYTSISRAKNFNKLYKATVDVMIKNQFNQEIQSQIMDLLNAKLLIETQEPLYLFLFSIVNPIEKNSANEKYPSLKSISETIVEMLIENKLIQPNVNSKLLIEKMSQFPQLLKTYLMILHYQKHNKSHLTPYARRKNNTLATNLTQDILNEELDVNSYRHHLKIWAAKTWSTQMLSTAIYQRYEPKSPTRLPKHGEFSRVYIYKEMLKVDRIDEDDFPDINPPQPPRSKLT
jgi:hypothetical protein